MSKTRKYIDLTLSLLFTLSFVLGYYKDVSHMSEYCFVSGLLVGITFFLSFLHQQTHEKPLNACIYLACVVDIFIIFIATVSIGLNLEGAFWFIHIINPVILVVYWFVFCDQRMMNRFCPACNSGRSCSYIMGVRICAPYAESIDQKK